MPGLQPADVDSMLKPAAAFGGLRLEGENIHRGRGNYKVSRSTFACNRVRLQNLTIWHIKEYEKIALSDRTVGLFYSGEGYVIRWGYTITVVRELEGLTPGKGGFAKDRQYHKLLEKERGGSKEENQVVEEKVKDSDSESDSDEDSGDEVQRILESGGRQRCAYFFWQGLCCRVFLLAHGFSNLIGHTDWSHD